MTREAARPRKALRLFFALWPDDALRGALAAAAAPALAQVTGQPVPPGNLHVTLAFLGSTPASALVRLIQVGGQGPWPPVALAFGRIEYWAKPKVLVALPATVPAAGAAIVDRLWAALEPLGFTRELRPWRPHLTLARRLRRPPPENLALAPLPDDASGTAWRLALVESTAHHAGPRYRPIADWGLSPLAGCSPSVP